MTKEEVLTAVKDSLRLDKEETTRSEYTGGYDGQPLYVDHKTINIRLLCDIGENTHVIDEIEFEVR